MAPLLPPPTPMPAKRAALRYQLAQDFAALMEAMRKPQHRVLSPESLAVRLIDVSPEFTVGAAGASCSTMCTRLTFLVRFAARDAAGCARGPAPAA